MPDDPALAISAYVVIARTRHDRGLDLSLLERLGRPIQIYSTTLQAL